MSEQEEDLDPDRELWQHIDRLQQGATDGRPLEALITEAVELVALANEPRFAAATRRVCVYDRLVVLYGQLDERGFADEIVDSVTDLRREVQTDNACYYCLTVDLVGALGARGEHERAWQETRDALRQLPRGELFSLTYGPALAHELASLATATDDAARAQYARDLVDRDADRIERIVSGEDHPWFAKQLQNAREHQREVAVLATLAQSDLDAALGEYDQGIALDAPNWGRFEVEVVLAERMVRARHPRARELVLSAFSYADTRDLPRYLSLLALCALELGLEEPRWPQILRRQLPRLRSTDLHERAAAFGIAP